MDPKRRSFLKRALSAGCGFPLLAAGCSALKEGSAEASTDTQWAMVVDVEKCLDAEVREACREACHREHHVPTIPDREHPELPDAKQEVKWIWSESYEHAFPDQSHPHTTMKDEQVLVLCNHCSSPSCTRVCPTGATWKREQDGLVMMDMHRCIGCRYCMAACPYGARSFNWRDPREYLETDADGKLATNYPTRSKGVVEKCTFCAERLRVGRPPACVEAAAKVPGGEGALTFGDLSDENSEVRQILSRQHTICRRVSLGTGPNVFYIV